MCTPASSRGAERLIVRQAILLMLELSLEDCRGIGLGMCQQSSVLQMPFGAFCEVPPRGLNSRRSSNLTKSTV